jgi:Tat protein translocase TatB subunit
MNIFGMGPLELLVVLMLALVFLGPEKLPEVLGQLGKVYREVRKMTNELSAEFNDSMQEFKELQDFDLGLSEMSEPEPAAANVESVPSAPELPASGDITLLEGDTPAFETPVPAVTGGVAVAEAPTQVALTKAESFPAPDQPTHNGHARPRPSMDDLLPPY